MAHTQCEITNKLPPMAEWKLLKWIIDSGLISAICPADLADAPCLRDELGGCECLRLCRTKRKYPQPVWTSHGFTYIDLPPCPGVAACEYIHGIMPTCRSIQKQVARNGEPEQQFKRVLCNNILAGTPCEWGHEKEGARTLMLFMYEEHQAQAKREGARDRVLRRLSARNQLQNYWRPIPTNPRCLKDPYIYPDGTVTAWTHHQFPVTLMYIKDAAFLSDLADKQRRREYEERLAHQQQLEQERLDRQLEHNRRITQELLERARQALMARHYSSGASHPSNSEDHHDLAAVDHDSSTSWSSIVPCLSPSVISASFEWTPSQDPTTFEECLTGTSAVQGTLRFFHGSATCYAG